MLPNHICIRIKETGQIIEMVPAAAIAKLNAGTAELVDEEKTLGARVRSTFETATRFLERV